MKGRIAARLKSSKNKTVKTCIDVQHGAREKKKDKKKPADNEKSLCDRYVSSRRSFLIETLSSSSEIAASVFRKWLITIVNETDADKQ